MSSFGNTTLSYINRTTSKIANVSVATPNDKKHTKFIFNKIEVICSRTAKISNGFCKKMKITTLMMTKLQLVGLLIATLSLCHCTSKTVGKSRKNDYFLVILLFI